MTDALSALVSPLARHPSATERSALVGNDDQPDFGQALASPQKDEPKSKGQPSDPDAPRKKGLHKLAERLAARDARVTEPEGDTLKTEPTSKGEQLDVSEPLLPDAAAKEVKPDQVDEAPLPLLLALSELRKAGGQPANAASVDAPDVEASDVNAQPDISGDEAELSALVVGGKSPRPAAAGTALPPGMAPTPQTQPAAQPATKETAAANDAGADKPVRPTLARQGDQPSAGNSVTIISEQAIPAPASSGANSTAGALALDIASAAPRHTAAATAVQQLQASTTNTPGTQVLKIQLRPVELGMVTANLRLAGEQLSIEIEVENAEAYVRLSADREAINTALRGLGFDVDRVTILQPQQANSAQPRNDGGATAPGSGGRDQPSFQSGGTGSEGGNSGNGRPGGRAANDEGSARNISSSRADRPDSSRYI
ncbi:flagellar hook-length control protein FliK [Aminobacter sp. UC22_36]|uniref:flagellar hook-length control protein FliK n=1 Tax=Aminobacter sp. UC22_36 TaxID=3374549 RepID=UPI003756F060